MQNLDTVIDWTAGYVIDVAYVPGYYIELNPMRVRLAFLNAGLVPPRFGTACELGYGQGLSANLHAAASVEKWFGTDFNPAQAGFAQEVAALSGAGARFYDQSFEEFCTRADLPDFDYIGLHGIWSWISDANRAVIVDFIGRKLKVGGVVYISYNTLPGWAGAVPLRDLLAAHSEVMSARGQGIVNRIGSALDFAERLFATEPMYARVTPHLSERLKLMKDQNRNYLAHEFFNRDWQPMSFGQVAEWLKPAKLSFACSADYLSCIPTVNLTAAQQSFLSEIPDPMFRETVRDFIVNQQFRKDYWVRGARKLDVTEQAAAMRAQRVMLVQPREGVSLELTSTVGRVKFNENVYVPILDVLADHQPKSLSQIEQAVKDKGIVLSNIIEAVILLIGMGTLAAVQDDPNAANAKKQTDRLNAFLCAKAQSENGYNVLASPVTGGGAFVDRFQQLFLIARSQGKKQPNEWAQFLWRIFADQGRKLVKDDKTLETAEENIAELIKLAQTFSDKQLPILKSLGIA